MSTNLFLAARNLLRNRRRSLLNLLSMIAASSAIIVFSGYIDFSLEGLRESTIHTEIGHFQVGQPGFTDNEGQSSEAHMLMQPLALEALLEGLPHVKAVAQRLAASALISGGDRALPAKLIGILPEREAGFASADTLIAGRQLVAGDSAACVVGNGLARTLGLKPGMVATLLGSTVHGVINAIDCKVVGIVRTPSAEYDKVYVKLPLPLLQQLLDTHGIDKLSVLIADTRDLPSTLNALKKKLRVAYQIRVWNELADYYNSVAHIYQSIFSVTSAVLGIVIVFGVANSMSMSVMERMREFGTQRALGQTRAGLLGQLLSEGLLLGLCGAGLGCLTGLLLASAINQAGGIQIPPPPGMSEGYTAFIRVHQHAVLQAIEVCLACSMLSSIYPAWLAARLDPVEALLHL